MEEDREEKIDQGCSHFATEQTGPGGFSSKAVGFPRAQNEDARVRRSIMKTREDIEDERDGQEASSGGGQSWTRPSWMVDV